MQTTSCWKSLRVPGILLGALCAGFVAYVLQTQYLLPDRVASHFGPGGLPDSWMSRSSFISLMLLLCLGLVLLMLLAGVAVRFVPSGLVNIPNRDYWLAPERRQQTSTHVIQYLLWLSCMEVLFLAAMHALTIEANRSVPVQLPGKAFATILVCFLLGVAVWTLLLLRRFRKRSEPEARG